jgi:hypothetical protein
MHRFASNMRNRLNEEDQVARAPRSHHFIRAIVTLALGILPASALADDLLPSLVPTPLAPFFASPPSGVADGVPPIEQPDLAGRWLLNSSGVGFCYVTFSGRPGAVKGIISPESGCPQALFASRRWTADPGGVTISDRRGVPLARIYPVRRGRFEGEADAGRWIFMTR